MRLRNTFRHPDGDRGDLAGRSSAWTLTIPQNARSPLPAPVRLCYEVTMNFRRYYRFWFFYAYPMPLAEGLSTA